ncbi:hypothetical protein KBV55_004223 [Salmonella enterica]|nr:hypothetical protein [Salmonella enterica]EAW2232660.1 hypothetical protein [Salmonella enterica subsp. enterica]EEP3165506.1 hypothetical protein [Salmonella enterica subsp. houtenae serovar 43:z4,z32:-]EBH3347469.1 hypothetical protein [Salmonella enterica]EBH6588346.1 hypothetical protein [Salmonella enterica]
MGKFIVPIVNVVLCTYIVAVCLICLIELDSWQDKVIAVTITIGSAYVIALVLNKFLPTKIRIFGGVFEVLSGPLLIIGAIACIAFLDPWPVKIIGMFLWVVIMFCLPSFLNKDKE